MSLAPLPTLDQLAADPAKAVGLPLDATEKLLAQAHVAEGALLARLLVARSQGNGQPEAPAEDDRDRLLTPEEAASMLGLTVEQLKRRRSIPRKSLGRRTVRYSRRALDRWLTQRSS